MHRQLIRNLCEEVCAERNIGYISWERTIHDPSQPSSYHAIGGDGDKMHRIPLSKRRLDLAQAMEKWVQSGVGSPPAAAEWFTKKR
jgi:hypothetical protein